MLSGSSQVKGLGDDVQSFFFPSGLVFRSLSVPSEKVSLAVGLLRLSV